jgi:hypothetical protein
MSLSMKMAETKIGVTLFSSYAASSKIEKAVSLEELAEMIRNTVAPAKGDLPWLKLARLGNTKTVKGSLRHDANVLSITGIEADYDAEDITIDAAAAKLEQAGVTSIIYTSPSHTPTAPRWRILCPLSSEVAPLRREHLMGRLNGLFGGIFAAESFTLSQSYYYGHINGSTTHDVRVIEGTTIESHDDLDEVWIGRPHTTQSSPSGPYQGAVDRDGLLGEILNGKYHNTIVRLAGLFARERVAPMEARQRLAAAMESIPEHERDARWVARYADLDRCVFDIYGKEAIARAEAGASTFRAAFDPGWTAEGVSRPQTIDHETGEILPDFQASALADMDIDSIRPRRWLYGRELLKGFVSALGSMGGVGKTAYTMVVGLSVVTDRSLFHPGLGRAPAALRVHKSGAVWFYNLEDPQEELLRRVKAALMHHRVSFDEVKDRVYIDSGRDRPLIIASRNEKGDIIATPVVDQLVAELKRRGITLLVVDPFVNSHGAEENRNEEMNIVMRLWAQVANDADCAVWLIHHFRKGGQGGDGESFRGAGAIQGAARSMSTLSPMSPEEAKKLGIADDERRQYVRLDNAKANMAPGASSADWYKLVGVNIGNADSEYPDGDSVHTLEPWNPPSPFDGVPWTDVVGILDRIEAGPGEGERYAFTRQSKDRWAGNIVQEVTCKSPEQAVAILRAWKEAGVLEEGQYNSPRQKGSLTGCVSVNKTKLTEMRSMVSI